MIKITKPKKLDYRIQYVDNTYQLVQWTQKEFKEVGMAMGEGKLVGLLDDGLFRLDHIRAIVFLPPVPEPTEEEKKVQEEEQLTEWGFVDAESARWLKENGIDLGKGVN